MLTTWLQTLKKDTKEWKKNGVGEGGMKYYERMLFTLKAILLFLLILMLQENIWNSIRSTKCSIPVRLRSCKFESQLT